MSFAMNNKIPQKKLTWQLIGEQLSSTNQSAQKKGSPTKPKYREDKPEFISAGQFDEQNGFE